jgi:hypothetical protein
MKTILRFYFFILFTSLLLPNRIQAQTWTQISPVGSLPTPRDSQSAVYDTTNNCMTIFGGVVVPGYFVNDVWVLGNANGLGETPAWTELFPTDSTPSGRFGHTAIYDPTSNRMTIFGGINTLDNLLNDVWVLSNANGVESTTPAWTQLNPNPDATYGFQQHV